MKCIEINTITNPSRISTHKHIEILILVSSCSTRSILKQDNKHSLDISITTNEKND